MNGQCEILLFVHNNVEKLCCFLFTFDPFKKKLSVQLHYNKMPSRGDPCAIYHIQWSFRHPLHWVWQYFISYIYIWYVCAVALGSRAKTLWMGIVIIHMWMHTMHFFCPFFVHVIIYFAGQKWSVLVCLWFKWDHEIFIWIMFFDLT